jgi:hypothetical protein
MVAAEKEDIDQRHLGKSDASTQDDLLAVTIFHEDKQK